MTLIKYNTKTVKHRIARQKPALKLHRKDACCLNGAAVDLTRFKQGDKVSIVSSITKSVPYDIVEWFLVKDEDGYELRAVKNKIHLNLFNNYLARTVLDKNLLTGDVYSIKIAPKPTTLEDGSIGWCLLMGSAIK